MGRNWEKTRKENISVEEAKNNIEIAINQLVENSANILLDESWPYKTGMTLTERKKKLTENIKENDKQFKALNSQIKQLHDQLAVNDRDQKFVEQKIEGFRKKHKMDSADNIMKEIEEIDNSIDAREKEVREIREGQQALLREKDKLEFHIQTIDDKIRKVHEVEKENKDKIYSADEWQS